VVLGVRCELDRGRIEPTCAPVYVPPGSTQSINWQDSPRKMINGIVVLVSSDPIVKTAPVATNEAYFEVCFERGS